MQATDFIKKWEASELKERSASQSHFNDLCALLGIEDPISADPKGDWFTFERGASKTSGGEGWADVWRKGCFAWEYKGKKKDLDKAFDQLLQYSIALENPPLLIVSDMTRIRIHTNWTNTVQQVHEITTPDLLDASKRDFLRACFTDPESLRPSKTRQALTEEAAQKFALLAQRLRSRKHDPETVAHFVNRLVFCMFAEDVELLPNKMFQKMLELCQKDPSEFQPFAKDLFAAMHAGGRVGFEKVEWFNGGLFDDDTALPLEKEDLQELLAAAKLDWSEIDPSILGTLFERGLDPDKRSQLGAHYTDRDKIMQIVGPVVVEPLLAEWAEVKTQIEAALSKAESAKSRSARTKAEKEAERLHAAFLERLRGFRVLDPACGSGNFLYLSLLALKDIEHRTNLEAEALGLPRGFPTIGPECVKGIELNPYAAELARVSVWVGEIQWMRRNGFDAARNPILRPLGTIENRDAVLAPDGSKADWPDADVVVGNPPFLGNKRMISALGEEYTVDLRKAWNGVPGGVDLVTYWFAKAWDMMREGRIKRVGLVSTNSIRGGANREVLKSMLKGGRIFNAWSDEDWTVEGAAVRVSMICFDQGGTSAVSLNGSDVTEIYSDLTSSTGSIDLTKSKPLASNKDLVFQGMKFVGPFDISEDAARAWLALPRNPNGRPNSEVVKRWMTGIDLTRRPEERWVVDFGVSMTEHDAALYEAPFTHVETHVKTDRLRLDKEGNFAVRRENHRKNWWRYGEARPGMRAVLEGRARYIATPEVAKHRFFVFLAQTIVPTGSIYAIGRDDDTTFGILHSRFHELWALRMGTSLEDRPRYTPSSTFETFPFPEDLTPDISAADYANNPRAEKIGNAAFELNRLRENWLNPSDLVDRVPEMVEGYPDRLIPKDDKAAKELKKRTLTNLYNARPAWLDNAHKKLDEAVAEAYGWGDDWRDGKLTDDEILARLFRLNQERAAKQDKA
ncbi:class I SAM-dependent DNA methyltransferase [Phaeobacter gallaeciensis]|uniref:class I SAM-dependent DNA methyltransferase n=1 Tax=Phaeobacter gallaeciensis TaxID=60890 RepID=UPI00237F4C88|nr:class I SAM-dependent DNA methyltransferase [Phaeobacter gallaeciensis]MDE4060089.1 class I SAM-dependent DNA methyltransferase [Phaeobacter gallaeciensis]MDE4123108.1 class I SAM-dependent DNA methyltransferase [Phaeobacter gallaeciensis]MDE4127776.1 class I SAM-dependent DNA methyltransferase [Phaeobacter gallaeciensis]